jgi:hypothetical protein
MMRMGRASISGNSGPSSNAYNNSSNANQHQNMSSASSTGGGGDSHHDNKDLRKFLDGIGETDVPSDKHHDFMGESDDAIPGALPPEFRDYLGNSTSPSTNTSPTSALPPIPSGRINNINSSNMMDHSGDNGNQLRSSTGATANGGGGRLPRKASAKGYSEWNSGASRKRTNNSKKQQDGGENEAV